VLLAAGGRAFGTIGRTITSPSARTTVGEAELAMSIRSSGMAL